MSTNVSLKNLNINLLTKEQYNSITPSLDELYFIEESDKTSFLLTVSEIEPTEASVGDLYYSLIDDKIYTFDGMSWINGTSANTDVLYITRDTKYTYVWDGNELINVGGAGGGIENIDNISITENDNGEIQTVGVIEQNKNKPIYDWVGTKAEYDALGQYNDDWFYYITDDDEQSSNMSMNNILNRLNRAYAWSNKSISGSGTVYSMVPDQSNPYIFILNNTVEDVKDIICDKSLNLSSSIINSKLYINSLLVDDTMVWTDISTTFPKNRHYAIGNGKLYYYDTLNQSLTLIENTNGCQKLSCDWYNQGKMNVIIKDMLYSLSTDTNELELVDESGVWTDLFGGHGSNNYCYGIRNGMLCAIDTNKTYYQSTIQNPEYVSSYKDKTYAIENGVLYKLDREIATKINDTYKWVKAVSNMGLTESGLLFNIDDLTLTQVGTTSDFQDISPMTVNNQYYAIKSGNVVYLSNESGIYNEEAQVSSDGNASNLLVCFNTGNVSTYDISWITNGANTSITTVYTVPFPNVGYTIYSDIDMDIYGYVDEVSYIHIKSNGKTFIRDGVLDRVFNGVSNDSKKQLLTMYDLITAIKG